MEATQKIFVSTISSLLGLVDDYKKPPIKHHHTYIWIWNSSIKSIQLFVREQKEVNGISSSRRPWEDRIIHPISLRLSSFRTACIWCNTPDCQIILFDLSNDDITNSSSSWNCIESSPLLSVQKLDFLKVSAVFFYFQTRENVQYVCPTLDEGW